MRYAQVYFLSLVSLGMMGCETTPKVDNPVLGPPPPRLESALKQQKLKHAEIASRANDRKSVLEGDFEDSENPFETPVITASTTSSNSTDEEADDFLSDSTVVAMVNGAPLFVSDVIGIYDFQLKQAEQRMPPEEYKKLRRALVKRDLKGHIERQLLIHEMKSTLKKEQLDQLQEVLETAFEEERIPELQKGLGVNSPQELEEKLNQQGRSLYSERELFIKQQSAIQFMAVKAKATNDYSREEVLARYKANIKDYEVPSKVRWQRIRITYAKQGGKEKAVGVLDEVIHKLQAGEDFGELAKKYSDGTRAERNGQWGWTRRGSLAEPEIEKALFELPIGQTSQVYETANSFQIIKVNDRKEAGHIPFADVQGKLEQSMISEARMKATKEILEELHAKAVIETIFDLDEEEVKSTNSAVQ
ncbi:Foldase protein PrsA precursor [Gimesia alba]|uniref:Foldase protein PrsA n=1 Tax=Gimesia alba TaxID=2527973 RepID=A0A517RLE4_9PLAN|nr:peptidylprolyl isomerase [Gimesia alba]QDT44669.1 Foldase protein PrsA precursor [Gimesia alba]